MLQLIYTYLLEYFMQIITEGANDMSGKVVELNQWKTKIKVAIEMFGRETIADLEFHQEDDSLLTCIPTMLERFIRYVEKSIIKINNDSYDKSQWEFLEMLRDVSGVRLLQMVNSIQRIVTSGAFSQVISRRRKCGASDVYRSRRHGGFNAENINPQIHENYNGGSDGPPCREEFW